MKKRILLSSITVLALTALAVSCTHSDTKPYAGTTPPAHRGLASEDLQAAWAYDGGPNPDTEMGKELIDIVAKQPFMPGISEEITGEQKFRPAFGPTLWRMIQKPNSVKILFIGQDGTHIAEAAGRTATAGFGGRAQDLAAYFGVRTGAAFMNAFAFTIRGQYSAFQTPVISGEEGKRKVSISNVVENGIWMMSQDQSSPMVQWRNSLIDWIIRNNKDSLRMIVLFGGPAQDSIATFIESKGGKVGSYQTEESLKRNNVKVPTFDLVNAGGNKEFPVVLNRQGKDIYAQMLGRRLNYKPANKDEKESADVTLALKTLQTKINDVYGDLMISNAGVADSGVMHPAQIGGYDLNKIEIDGKKTLSLKGLPLSDGSKVRNDILIAEFPHPTSLSMMTPPAASAKIATSLKLLKSYVDNGWKIEADDGMTNEFAAGKAYAYGRTDIGPAYYDFGTPKNRMVSVSSASRMTGNSNVVVIGTRDKVQFDMTAIRNATKARMPANITAGEMMTARPRLADTRYQFDLGPGEKMARIMKENLNMKVIGKMKDGKAASETCKAPEPASKFYIKSHPLCVGDFGHYRGTFDNPKVVILADPADADDILTSRALTGARGQYLQGLMNDMGVNDNYLVIKTVPFGMTDATAEEWSVVMKETAGYRKAIFKEIMKGSPALVIADGAHAAEEINDLVSNQSPVVIIERTQDPSSGLSEAAAEISKVAGFKKIKASGEMAILPRTHLGFMSRVWEGTTGTRVFEAQSEGDKGSAYAIVVPEWAYKNEAKQSTEERKGVDTIKRSLEDNKLLRKNNKKFESDDDASYWYLRADFLAA